MPHGYGFAESVQIMGCYGIIAMVLSDIGPSSFARILDWGIFKYDAAFAQISPALSHVNTHFSLQPNFQSMKIIGQSSIA